MFTAVVDASEGTAAACALLVVVMADDLFALKNAFYLGNYGQAVSEALAVAPSPTVATERDYYKYRAYIEQGQYAMVLSEVAPNAPPALQAVKLLAT